MTKSEFIEVTGEIEGFYEKELTPEQSRIWYEELKKMTKERYRKISKEVYRNLKFMPRLSDIIEMMVQVPLEVKDNETYECEKCKGKGLIMYIKIIEEYKYEFVAKCTCLNGQRKSRKIPTIEKVCINYGR